MPVIIKHRVEQAFGPDCIFAIVDWKGFLGALDRNCATVTGTLEEVATPWGTGLSVAAAPSHVQFDWHGTAPLSTSPRSYFVRYFGFTTVTQVIISHGNADSPRNATFLMTYANVLRGGTVTNFDTYATSIAGWHSLGLSNAGVNGGANILYFDGLPVASGTNAGNLITGYSDLFLFLYSPVAYGPCPVGATLQETLVFKRALSAADHLHIHNNIIGASA